jgi:hypothetical protein
MHQPEISRKTHLASPNGEGDAVILGDGDELLELMKLHNCWFYNQEDLFL